MGSSNRWLVEFESIPAGPWSDTEVNCTSSLALGSVLGEVFAASPQSVLCNSLKARE